MPRGKKLRKNIAATALALRDQGESQQEVAKRLGLSQQTVSKIERGEGNWAKLSGEAWFDSYRRDVQRKHEAMLHELSGMALQRMEELIPASSLSSVSGAFNVMQDKIRLLAGQSTQNIAHSVRVEDDKLTKTLDALIKSFAADSKAKPIVEAESPCPNNGS